MKNLKVILGFLLFSIVGVLVTGIVLNYFGIEHGSLLIKAGMMFIAVNIVLYLLILIFSVFRNLLSVYIEKKQKAIGSKFRTTLVLSFLGLVFIPSVLLFILSNQLINNSIDTWFSLEVQKPIYDSMDVAKALYLKEKEQVSKGRVRNIVNKLGARSQAEQEAMGGSVPEMKRALTSSAWDQIRTQAREAADRLGHTQPLQHLQTAAPLRKHPRHRHQPIRQEP